MKFTFDKDEMLKQISICQEVITSKSPISIMSNVMLEATKDNELIIKATDTAVNFVSSIKVDVAEPGKTTLFCDKFMQILTSSPNGEIEFSQEDITASIRPLTKKRNFKIKSIASDKFPEMPDSSKINYFEIPSKDLREMIRQTIFAVSVDMNRYFMTGVYFEKKDNKLVMVSTDARRLSFMSKEISIPDFPSAIVPTKILNLILKHSLIEGTIKLAIEEKQMFVKFNNLEFSSKLLDGQFPNYQRVIPDKQEFKFTVNKNDLESSLKSTGIMLEKSVNRIVFNLSKNELKISCPETEIGTAEDTITCSYESEPIQFSLNYAFIMDPLKVINTESVVFEFKDGNKAVTIHPDTKDFDYFHVVMPMANV